MTNPTPHGQVPEALIDLIDAYAETRHRCGGIYNAKTEAARNAVIEALSGVRALSAAPSVLSDEAILNRTGCIDYSPGTAGYDLELIRWYRTQIASPAPQQSRPLSHPNREFPGSAKGAAITSESPTPPAEQQATKETSGGFHVWRDISTAPKDGSRFVATGHNYGLYSEGRHACVAQWFRGSWIEASEWNEASELTYLTHWMPLPSPPDDVAAPAEQQAAPKVAPAWGHHARKLTQWLHCMSHNDSYFGEPAGLVKQVTGELNRLIGAAPQPVAQQGAADGFFLLLPQRPKPEAPAGTVGLDWDAYSGAQMLAFGRDCSDAAIAALRTEQPAPATQQAGDVVAYLDVGAGGYLDLGSELSEDALQQLPKGRHALVIAGTYGIDGYVAAPQPAPDCHHRPPCDECAAIAAQGGKA
ncbi:DUF551 domain-containing protein [Acidovorax sp. IB03]|uniref:DUF551 domain-containing protein n=1 Tax=Acidovorax sp. IB03 TaxID=2779366 RepID=UPI0018E80BA7|nr:DUF551 domain-containing protein [Acidovorax sp. IB03]MBJ2162910.1 DUF551 domain-containing protein [Acidovorax sp. IB03]